MMVVQDDVPIWAGLQKGLPQLLHDPLRSGMLRYIAVENLAPFNVPSTVWLLCHRVGR